MHMVGDEAGAMFEEGSVAGCSCGSGGSGGGDVSEECGRKIDGRQVQEAGVQLMSALMRARMRMRMRMFRETG
jgi:hypothetical protein